MQILQVKMYSLRPFPHSLRSSFELPEWPYFNGVDNPPPNKFVQYLRDLGVVHYQDDYPKSKYAILIDQPDFSFRGMKPTLMYFNFCQIDDDNLKIIKWSNKGRPELRQKIHEVTGDDFAWYDWNSEIEVLEVSSTKVVCAPRPRMPMATGVRYV